MGPITYIITLHVIKQQLPTEVLLDTYWDYETYIFSMLFNQINIVKNSTPLFFTKKRLAY